MNKPHRNPEKMFLVIEQWEESIMTQVEFCRSQKIPKSTFYYWLKKYKEEKGGLQNPFIPLTIKGDEKSACVPCELTISYPNGVKVDFCGRPDTKYIRELIHIF